MPSRQLLSTASRVIALTSALLMYCSTIAREQPQWALLSREGECAELASLKRIDADLEGIVDPQALVAAMKKKNRPVAQKHIAAGPQGAIQVDVPSLGLSLIFVHPSVCSGAR